MRLLTCCLLLDYDLVKLTVCGLPLFVGDHSQRSFRELVVYGVVDSTHVEVIIAETAAHGEKQCYGVRLVFHRGQMKRSVLEF